ncbi:MAG: hypothetical protein P8Y63_04630 [Deltaproteobacteria bacterium]|jgi:hypothetical protein
MPLKKLLCALGLVLLTAGVAHAELSVYIQSLNVSAEANIGDFRSQLGVQYGVSGPSLDLVFRSVDSPADAAVVLWLGQHSRKPVRTVLKAYRSRKKHGWGAVAKSLGIKPGSADFHALKSGNLGWHPNRDHHTRMSEAKGRGGGKGHHHGGRGRR